MAKLFIIIDFCFNCSYLDKNCLFSIIFRSLKFYQKVLKIFYDTNFWPTSLLYVIKEIFVLNKVYFKITWTYRKWWTYIATCLLYKISLMCKFGNNCLYMQYKRISMKKTNFAQACLGLSPFQRVVETVDTLSST